MGGGMEKIKLNISGNLVGIKIPSTLAFEIIEIEVKRIVMKNYKLLKTLKFYNIINTNFNENEILKLEKIIESTVSLKSLKKNEKPNKVLERKNDYKLYYGNLKYGEKINSETNIVVLGELNQESYVQSRKNIFVYGRALGTIHAGCESNRCETTYIYVEEAEYLKVKIGEAELIYNDKETNKNIMFEKKMGKIVVKKIDKNQIKELMKKIGFDLI